MLRGQLLPRVSGSKTGKACAQTVVNCCNRRRILLIQRKAGGISLVSSVDYGNYRLISFYGKTCVVVREDNNSSSDDAAGFYPIYVPLSLCSLRLSPALRFLLRFTHTLQAVVNKG